MRSLLLKRYIQSPYFIFLAQSLRGPNSYSSISRTFDILDNHLGYRTWLDGHDMTTADWILWGALKGTAILTPKGCACLPLPGSPMSVGLLKLGRHRHLLRWYTHLESLDATQAALSALADARAKEAQERSRTPTPYTPLSPASGVAEKVAARPLLLGETKPAVSNPYFVHATTR